MSAADKPTDTDKDEKKLIWTARLLNALPNWRDYLIRAERQQYRTDVQALVCRGNLSKEEAQKVQMSLNLEWGIFALSRAIVPLCLIVMYRRGVFQESFQFDELKSIMKIGVSMHAIDLSGHFLMRNLTKEIVEKHIGINEESFAFKKKTVDDYLV